MGLAGESHVSDLFFKTLILRLLIFLLKNEGGGNNFGRKIQIFHLALFNIWREIQNYAFEFSRKSQFLAGDFKYFSPNFTIFSLI